MFIDLKNITPKDTDIVGKKAINLAKLIQLGYEIPRGFCISTDLYKDFILSSGIDIKIINELTRRDLKEMRWEELWDASLRIRNFFTTAPFDLNMRESIIKELSNSNFSSYVVRSSAPEEDSSNSSFAGLHESIVDVHETDLILESIKKVWSSLWSDSSLLYRKELNLEVRGSSMGVIIQELIKGEVSGVVFSKDPTEDKDQIVVECVLGLNEDLVDGTTAPFRYILSPKDGSVLSTDSGDYNSDSLLSKEDFNLLWDTISSLKKDIPYPFDLEWTIKDGVLYLLQIRPITTIYEDDKEKLWEKEDKRPWYRTLSLSFETLEKLKVKIEKNILPEMEVVGEGLRSCNLKVLSDEELIQTIKDRKELYSYWKEVYWENLIPFAHGVRLFGKIYNDKVKPDDPYEFTRLLSTDQMISIKRNSILSKISDIIKDSPKIKGDLKMGNLDLLPLELKKHLEEFMELSSTYKGEKLFKDISTLTPLLLSISSGYKKRSFSSPKELEDNFLSLFYEDDRIRISKILSLARSSWQLRDDDNIYLGGIEVGLVDAVTEGEKRFLKKKSDSKLDLQNIPDFLLKEKEVITSSDNTNKKSSSSVITYSARRFTGQPASPGIGSGRARVITSSKEVLQFQKGEVLVCDAIDPNMTFIVPLASAIIERRGGMLIHGAIIAREYGIPCVTGISHALTLISTGDSLVVDGYLGSVSISRD